MNKTRHFLSRIDKRNIRDKIIDLTLKFGAKHCDGKVVLNLKSLKFAREELNKMIKLIDSAINRKGCVVVLDKKQNTLITSYMLNQRENQRNK